MMKFIEALVAAAAVTVVAGLANIAFDVVKHTADFKEWEMEVTREGA